MQKWLLGNHPMPELNGKRSGWEIKPKNNEKRFLRNIGRK